MKIRIECEREIVRATIEAAIARGFKLAHVDDGDIVPTPDVDAAVEAVFAVDTAHVFFGDQESGYSWLFFVLGNSGWDVLSDYTTDLDNAVKDTDALVSRWEERLS
jgi:hypothetical protein